MNQEHLDNFDSFYEAAKSGWACRTVSHYKSYWNPDGVVNWCWRKKHDNIDVYPYNPETFGTGIIHFTPGPMIYCAQLGEAPKNLGYYGTLAEAQKVVERAYAAKFRGATFCPHCGERLTAQAKLDGGSGSA